MCRRHPPRPRRGAFRIEDGGGSLARDNPEKSHEDFRHAGTAIPGDEQSAPASRPAKTFEKLNRNIGLNETTNEIGATVASIRIQISATASH
jgi:hypothetical protein